MKLIKISMELIIDDNICELVNGIYNKNCIADYLNSKLYSDPKFFDNFGPENIESIGEFE